MFARKKKEVNYTTTTLSLVLGAALGWAYALVSTKKTGKEFQRDVKKTAVKALKKSKRKLGKEFVKAKKEIGDEFESQLIKSFTTIKDRSKTWFGKAKSALAS